MLGERQHGMRPVADGEGRDPTSALLVGEIRVAEPDPRLLRARRGEELVAALVGTRGNEEHRVGEVQPCDAAPVVETPAVTSLRRQRDPASPAHLQPTARTATKSRVQPTSHWSAGRF